MYSLTIGGYGSINDLSFVLSKSWLMSNANKKWIWKKTGNSSTWCYFTLWHERMRIRQWQEWRAPHHDLEESILQSKLHNLNTKKTAIYNKNSQILQVSDSVLWFWPGLIINQGSRTRQHDRNLNDLPESHIAVSQLHAQLKSLQNSVP